MNEVIYSFFEHMRTFEDRDNFVWLTLMDLPTTYIPSGRLYIYRCISTIEKNLPEGNKTRVIEGNYETNINIDYESDFDKLDFVYSRYEQLYNYLLTSGDEYDM